jgi:outer membrane protein assembly factor BamB
VTSTAQPLSVDRLHRDQYGFQKLVVAITTGGKLFALDSGNGQIVWSKNLGIMGVAGSELEVHDMWIVRELGEMGSPVLGVVAVRTRGEVGGGLGLVLDPLTVLRRL